MSQIKKNDIKLEISDLAKEQFTPPKEALLKPAIQAIPIGD